MWGHYEHNADKSGIQISQTHIRGGSQTGEGLQRRNEGKRLQSRIKHLSLIRVTPSVSQSPLSSLAALISAMNSQLFVFVQLNPGFL